MEILWWLAPAAAVTLVAMTWVTWHSRDPRAVDRETAARRIGEALARQDGTRADHVAPRRTPDPATGVKVRRHASGTSGTGGTDGTAAREQRAS